MSGSVQLAPWLMSLNVTQATAFFLAVNVLLVGYSIGLWTFTRRMFHDSLFERSRPVTRGDILLTCLCILANVLISLIGWQFWQWGRLPLGTGGWGQSVLDFCKLLLIMDFGMYVTHRIAHIKWIYPWLHGAHHDHVETNALSLFVLSPLEVLGFGGLMLLAILLAQPTEAGLTAYLSTNLTVGTLGHAGVRLLPAAKWSSGLDTSAFHMRHHTQRECNYGFYTPVWDWIFGTLGRE